jgi:hypothetical protein
LAFGMQTISLSMRATGDAWRARGHSPSDNLFLPAGVQMPKAVASLMAASRCAVAMVE